MSSVLIVNGRVIDPASSTDRVADVAIADGVVAAIGANLSRANVAVVLDATDRIVCPGLIDPHVHLREPGMEEAETIATGTRAAVRGGFTSICCMPNTTPALDDDSMIEFIYKQTDRTGVCRVFPVGAATKGRRGEELAEIALMARAGAVGFSDDGDCIASAGMMHRVLTYIRPTGLAFMQHCQDPTLTAGASMHSGSVSARLGLAGWPRSAEEIVIERDVRLNRGIGCAYHVQHMSSGGSVEIIRQARHAQLPVTAEVTPHHLLLTHHAVENGQGYDTNAKVNPPLREDADRQLLLDGVADGTITVLATDHAPHTAERKSLPFENAPFGLVGLESALALFIDALITPKPGQNSGVLTWPGLLEMMTIAPARLCRLDRESAGSGAGGLGRLHSGLPADVTIIDPDARWVLRADEFSGPCRNTPFDGRPVVGRAVLTMVAGEVRHHQESSPIRVLRGSRKQEEAGVAVR